MSYCSKPGCLEFTENEKTDLCRLHLVQKPSWGAIYCTNCDRMKEERDEALRVREQSRLGAEREHEKVRDLRAKLERILDARDTIAQAVQDGLDSVGDCTCHIAPPCSACTDKCHIVADAILAALRKDGT